MDKEAADQWASEVADLQSKRLGRGGKDNEPPGDRRIAPIELWRGEVTVQPSVAGISEIARQFKQYRTSVHGAGADLRIEWTPPDKGLPIISFQLPAAALFASAFNQARWDRAFSTMALATPDGRVVFAVGAQAAEVKASGVASLLPVATEKEGPNLVRFAGAIADEPVGIAGIKYRMFTQPCCRAGGLTPANSSPSGLVVLGLADADAMRSLSLAISPCWFLRAPRSSCRAWWAGHSSSAR